MDIFCEVKAKYLSVYRSDLEWQYYLTLKVPTTTAADDILNKICFLLSRQNVLTLHVTHLPSRQFT